MIGEDQFIDQLKKSVATAPVGSVLGIGDDCAVIPKNEDESYLITTDSLVEGVHFNRDQITPSELAHKTIAVNLSDVAAMGARANYAFMNIAIPNSFDEEWLSLFRNTLSEQLREFDVVLLGGDTTRSLRDLFVSLTVVGSAKNENIKLRSGARVGDVVFVTKTLGDSRIAFEAISSTDETYEPDGKLRERHFKPTAEIDVGQWLGARSEVTAMMDLSDGLQVDLQRMAAASSCGFRIDVSQLPISVESRKACDRLGRQPEDFAVVGGEDYALLLTVNKDTAEELSESYRRTFGREIFRIGEVTQGAHPSFVLAEKEFVPAEKSYSHFS